MQKIKLLIPLLFALAGLGCQEIIFQYLAPRAIDPKLEWHTISTPHFDIHYHSGLEDIAPKVARICEEVRDTLTKEIGSEPWGKVQVVVNDIRDRTDDLAAQVPYPEILLSLKRPEPYESLANYEDWLRLVITHEYTHIVHLDMVGGFWTPFRYVFGHSILPASVIPSWMSEGYAVFQESDKTGRGRNRSAFVDMVLRMDALEDHTPPIDRLTLGTDYFPYGAQAYFYGGRFFDWLAQKHPKSEFATYYHSYSSNALNFFLLNQKASQVFGKSYYGLYRDFIADLKTLYAQEKTLMEKIGLIEGTRLTVDGEGKQGLLYSADGNALIYSNISGDRHAELLSLPLAQPESRLKPKTKILRYEFAAADLTWGPGSEEIYYSNVKPWKNYYSYSLMNRLDLKKDTVDPIRFEGPKIENPTRMPRNPMEDFRRTSNPHASAQGNLVFVFRGNNNDSLWTATLDENGPYQWNKKHYQIAKITQDVPETEYDHPRWSPDGKLLAVSKFDPQLKQRDIVLLHTDGTFAQFVTKDAALDFNPVWDAPGDNLFFVSDRTGVFNVFCFNLKNRALYQVTNVLGGTFFPALSPDGTRLAYLGYHSKGFDVYELTLDKTHFIKAGKAPEKGNYLPDHEKSKPPKTPKKPKKHKKEARLYDKNAVELIDPSNDDGPQVEASPSPSPSPASPSQAIKDYSPFKTLFLPRFISPYLQILNINDVIIGGMVGGTDPIRRHSWEALAYYWPKVNEPGGMVMYQYMGWYPELFITGSMIPVGQTGLLYVRSPNTGILYAINGQFKDGIMVQRDLITKAGLSFKIPISVVPGKHTISGGYEFISRKTQSDINPAFVHFANTSFPTPVYLPTDYDASGFFLRYAYDSAINYRRGISPTGEINTPKDLLTGYSLAIEYQGFNSGLGGNYNQSVLTADLRQYRRIPFTDHHVLALRGVGAFTYGDKPNPGTFRLGGAYSEGVYNTTTRDFYPLRGFGGLVTQGEHMFLLSAEYRFPIVTVDRGLGTFPLFLNKVHGAFFADYGDARDRFGLYNDHLRFDQGFMGTGAELRSNWQIFYNVPLDFRIGWGVPVLARKNASFNPGNGELIINLGTTF